MQHIKDEFKEPKKLRHPRRITYALNLQAALWGWDLATQTEPVDEKEDEDVEVDEDVEEEVQRRPKKFVLGCVNPSLAAGRVHATYDKLFWTTL